MGFSKHTKTVFGKMFYDSFYAYQKCIFYNLKIFFTKMCCFGQNMCFQTGIHLKLSVTKDLFLNVNLKTRFFEGQNRQSKQK